MITVFKNRYKLSLTLAAFFILGMAASLFVIYSLPVSLRLSDGYQSEFFHVYVVIATTFAIGSLGIVVALRYKREIVVFRDRSIDVSATKSNETEQGKSSIVLDGVVTAIQQADDKKGVFELGLNAICKQLEAGQGAIYSTGETEGKRNVDLVGGYALNIGESAVLSYEFGEGLIGQAAVSGRSLYVDDVPEGYVKIVSGLGSASPKYLLIVPLKYEGQVLGVMEIASFTALNEDQRKFADEAGQLIANQVITKAS